MSETLGNIEALVAALKRRVEQQRIEADEVATRRVAEIQAEADRQRARAIQRIETRAKTEQEQVERRRWARAKLDVLHLTITAREALLDKVWSEAEARLRQLAESTEYAAVLERLAALAARELRQPRIELAADVRGHALLTPARLAKWGAAVGVEFQAAPVPVSAWGGLVACAGRNRYDATFPTRLERAREHLRQPVAARLGWEPT